MEGFAILPSADIDQTASNTKTKHLSNLMSSTFAPRTLKFCDSFEWGSQFQGYDLWQTLTVRTVVEDVETQHHKDMHNKLSCVEGFGQTVEELSETSKIGTMSLEV